MSDIVLKDRNDNVTTYKNVASVSFLTTEEGVEAVYYENAISGNVDYAENDSTLPSYIKNRPLYDEGDIIEELFNGILTYEVEPTGATTWATLSGAESTSGFHLIENEYYEVNYNNNYYYLKAFTIQDGIIAIGNNMVLDSSKWDGVPFVIMEDINGIFAGDGKPVFQSVYFPSITQITNQTSTFEVPVVIKRTAKNIKQLDNKYLSILEDRIDKINIFPATLLSSFSFNDIYKIYGYEDNTVLVSLEVGKIYQILWDGVPYECVAQDTSHIIENSISIGNLSNFPSCTGNNEPFIFVARNPKGILCGALNDEEPNKSHFIEIYQQQTSQKIKKEYYDASSLSTPNYEQNDSKGEGYIQNRPFYDEGIESIEIFNENFTFNYTESGGEEVVVQEDVIPSASYKFSTNDMNSTMFYFDDDSTVFDTLIEYMVERNPGDIIHIEFDSELYDCTVQDWSELFQYAVGEQVTVIKAVGIGDPSIEGFPYEGAYPTGKFLYAYAEYQNPYNSEISRMAFFDIARDPSEESTKYVPIRVYTERIETTPITGEWENGDNTSSELSFNVNESYDILFDGILYKNLKAKKLDDFKIPVEADLIGIGNPKLFLYGYIFDEDNGLPFVLTQNLLNEGTNNEFAIFVDKNYLGIPDSTKKKTISIQITQTKQKIKYLDNKFLSILENKEIKDYILPFIRTETGFYENQFGYIYETSYSKKPILGKTYTVFWDGIQYECTVEDASIVFEGALGLGNLTSVGLSGKNEPFAIVFAYNAAGLVALTDQSAGNNHCAEVYESFDKSELKEEFALQSDWDQDNQIRGDYIKNRPFHKEEVILFETTYQNPGVGEFYGMADFSNGDLIEGELYDVVWNGKIYHNLKCEIASGVPAIGNLGILEGAPDLSGPPFGIARDTKKILTGVPIWVVLSLESSDSVSEITVQVKKNKIKYLNNEYLSIMEIGTPEKEILPQQSFSLQYIENSQVYIWEPQQESDFVFLNQLENNTKYLVKWGDQEFICDSQDLTKMLPSEMLPDKGVILGNIYIQEDSTMWESNEPFCIMMIIDDEEILGGIIAKELPSSGEIGIIQLKKEDTIKRTSLPAKVSNWNEVNPNKSSFIENRPFGYSMGQTIANSKITLYPQVNYDTFIAGALKLNREITLNDLNSQFLVNFKGEEFICEAKDLASLGGYPQEGIYLGNPAIMPDYSQFKSKEPFFMIISYGDSGALVGAIGITEVIYQIKISEIDQNKIDKKWLPDTLPEVTEENDEGKFLRVVGGKWTTATVLNAEEVNF